MRNSTQRAHNNLLALDKKFGTWENSPLHHDNRPCPACNGLGEGTIVTRTGDGMTFTGEIWKRRYIDAYGEWVYMVKWYAAHGYADTICTGYTLDDFDDN